MSEPEERKIVFITNDRWLLEKGKLDPTDEEILKETAQGGEIIMMNMAQALETMKEEEPEKFSAFQQDQEKRAGRPLTLDELTKLSQQADERWIIYHRYVELMMTNDQAIQVRVWRVNEHFTWRAVARAAFGMAVTDQWQKWRVWAPPSNQLMGMALCHRAAEFFDENDREPPWN